MTNSLRWERVKMDGWMRNTVGTYKKHEWHQMGDRDGAIVATIETRQHPNMDSVHEHTQAHEQTSTHDE
jgi:hypothetical protein